MNVEVASVLTRCLMSQHGLQDWSFSVAPYTAALSERKLITVSDRIEMLTDEAATDAILHAIAHAHTGPDHDDDWQAVAEQVGADPDGDCIRIEGAVAWCRNCGNEFRRNHPPKQRHFCVACGPRAGSLEFFSMEPVPCT